MFFQIKGMNKVSLTYWMNKLQNIDYNYPIFVTLNPLHLPDKEKYSKLSIMNTQYMMRALLMVSKN